MAQTCVTRRHRRLKILFAYKIFFWFHPLISTNKFTKSISLKTKYLLREFCKYVYYAGCGNFWYEYINKEIFIYRICIVISSGIYTTIIILENVAVLFGKFLTVEKFGFNAVIYNILYLKCICSYIIRNYKVYFEMGSMWVCWGVCKKETVHGSEWGI